ncbi:MAG: hypothetical protein HGJ97_19435 [Desulfosporosinus sp.]|nr:hypothetical protein [Desulfosporosinus sp.]
MNTKEYTQQIVDDLYALPKDKIVEVMDFVHFLKQQMQNQSIPLCEIGLTREEAFDLRRRLTTFKDNWNASDIDEYDN